MARRGCNLCRAFGSQASGRMQVYGASECLSTVASGAIILACDVFLHKKPSEQKTDSHSQFNGTHNVEVKEILISSEVVEICSNLDNLLLTICLPLGCALFILLCALYYFLCNPNKSGFKVVFYLSILLYVGLGGFLGYFLLWTLTNLDSSKDFEGKNDSSLVSSVAFTLYLYMGLAAFSLLVFGPLGTYLLFKGMDRVERDEPAPFPNMPSGFNQGGNQNQVSPSADWQDSQGQTAYQQPPNSGSYVQF